MDAPWVYEKDAIFARHLRSMGMPEHRYLYIQLLSSFHQRLKVPLDAIKMPVGQIYPVAVQYKQLFKGSTHHIIAVACNRGNLALHRGIHKFGILVEIPCMEDMVHSVQVVQGLKYAFPIPMGIGNHTD